MYKTTLYHGDCLEQMRLLEDNSIDLILCDLPYGTTDRTGTEGDGNRLLKWDNIIPLDQLWTQFFFRVQLIKITLQTFHLNNLRYRFERPTSAEDNLLSRIQLETNFLDIFCIRPFITAKDTYS